MKYSFLFILVQLTATILFAQHYTPVDASSKVEFRLKNLGFNTGGTFRGLQGAIHFDPADLPGSSFDVSIDAASINTDNDMRDSHLKKEEYFDVQKYPRIRFVSTKVTPSNKNGTLFLFGKLTIKDKTQDISFPFTATPSNGGYTFVGEFKINRKDFGIGGSSTLSDNVIISLNVVAGK